MQVASNILLQSDAGAAGPGPASQAGQMQIMLCDRDLRSRLRLGRVLRRQGHSLTNVIDTAELADGRALAGIDLLILGIDCLDAADITFCQSIRSDSQIAVMIFAERPCEHNCVRALDAGADDYLPKTASDAELTARIRALARRAGLGTPQPAATALAAVAFDGWRYQPQRRMLTAPAGNIVILTDAEHDLLWTLLRNAGVPLGRDRLLELTRQRCRSSVDRSIDVLVSRLRRKLRIDGQAEPAIQTIRGLGYMLMTQVRPVP